MPANKTASGRSRQGERHGISSGTGDERQAPKAEGPERASAQPGQYLTFFLAGEEYGAAILKTREILEFSALTAVPTTPPWIRGVLNLRGGVVPVIDLAVKFGLPQTEITDRTCVVILEVDLDGEKTIMGVIVDTVSKVVDLTAEAIDEPPAFGTQITVDYLQGIGRIGESFVLLLDVDRILSTDQLMAASEARGVEALESGRDPEVADSSVSA